MQSEQQITLRQYTNEMEAHIARGMLEAAGIECFIQDDNLVSTHVLLTNAVGGVKLKVREEDIERAEAALSSQETAQPDGAGAGHDEDGYEADAFEEDDFVDEEEELEDLLCPECKSGRITPDPQEAWKTFVSILLLGIPLLFMKRTWICRKCEHEWKR